MPGPGPDPEIETRTVTFNPNGGGFDDEGEAVRDVEKGAAVGELPVPSRLGYSFGGWWTAKTKVSASAVLEVSLEVEDTYEDYNDYDNPIEVPVRVRTATARFFSGNFVIEVTYTLNDGEVVDVVGKVWKK